jgi:hypothetical protein
MEDLRKTEEQDGFPTTFNERNRIRLTVPLIGEFNRVLLEKLTHQVNFQQRSETTQLSHTVPWPPGCGITPECLNLDFEKLAGIFSSRPSFCQDVFHPPTHPTKYKQTTPASASSHPTLLSVQEVSAHKKRLTVK